MTSMKDRETAFSTKRDFYLGSLDDGSENLMAYGIGRLSSKLGIALSVGWAEKSQPQDLRNPFSDKGIVTKK